MSGSRSTPDPVDDEGGLVKTSVILTRELVDRIREVQARSGLMNFSHFMRLFLRKHLPGYAGGTRRLGVEKDTDSISVHLTEDTRGVAISVAKILGVSVETLIAMMVDESMNVFVKRAKDRQDALRSHRESLGEE